jgi:hypothetical protein
MSAFVGKADIANAAGTGITDPKIWARAELACD